MSETNHSMDFPCTSCGLCCTTVGSLLDQKFDDPNVQTLIDAFPFDTVDGVCEMLKDGLCSVYDQRPILCNVKLVGIFLGLEQNQWYKAQAATCNKVIEENQLDSSYKVVLDF